MRATWSGMISFGLVNIPIKLYTSARSNDISFHQMHKDDSGRVGYRKVCKSCGNELDKDDIVKAYEYRKNQYVTVTDDELAQIPLQSAKTIAIQSFVDASQLDPVDFEKAYYMGPDQNGDRAYVLLRDALRKTGKVAIGKVTMRTREDLVAIRVSGDALVMEVLYYADELVNPQDIGLPSADYKVEENEINLAQVLIEHMTGDLDLSKFRDEYEAALKDLINKKIEGEEITAPAEVQPTKVVDIMAALKASLEAAEKERVPVEKKAA